MADARRGEVWLADLGSTVGHEQAGRRPVLVISNDTYNSGPTRLLIVLPVTSTRKGLALNVDVRAPEGGLRVDSAILCDALRSISRERLARRWGEIEPDTLDAVEERLRTLLQL